MADAELHETAFPVGDLVKTGDILTMVLSPDTVVARSSSPSHPQTPPSPSDKQPRTISNNAHAFTSMAARDSPTSALSFPSESGEFDGDSSNSSNERNEDGSGLQTPLLLNSHPSSSSGSTLCTQEDEGVAGRDTSYSDSCFEGIDNDAEEREQAAKHVAFHASTQVRYFVRSSSEIEGIKEFQANERRRRRKQKRDRIRQILEDDDDDDASCGEIEIEHRAPVPPTSIFQQVYGDILDLFRQDDESMDLDNEQPWFPIHCIQPQCTAEHAG